MINITLSARITRAFWLKLLLVGLLLTASRPALAQDEDEWSTPVMISTNTPSSWFSDVVVDSQGQPHVIWNSGRPSEQGQRDLLMYSTLVGQDWLEPNDIALTAYGGYTVRPAVAIDNASTLHATFRGETIIYYTQSPASEAWNANSWTPRKRISGAGAGLAYYSDVAVDAKGTIHVVWNESVSFDDSKKWLWLGAQNGGALHDGSAWRPQEQEELDNREIYTIVEDEAGVQWFGTDQGVYRFDGHTWQTLTISDGLIAPRVNCVTYDLDGILWFGTDAGVSLYDEHAPQGASKWMSYTVDSGLPGNMVRAMVTDLWGNVWVGTDKGLASYDGQSWMHHAPRRDELSAAEILALAADDRGNVWVGTRRGVSRYNGLRWSTYTATDGLLSNVVTAIAADWQGTIWFGTDSGLSRFDGQEWSSYTAQDGLVGGAVAALTIDSQGIVWVGTEQGVSHYNGQAWETLELPPHLAGQKITAIAQDRLPNAICTFCSDIFYRRSTDGGKSWSNPVNLSDSFAGSVKPQVRVGNGDNLYVTWEEGEDWYAQQGYPVASMFAHSPDGGQTWVEPTTFTFAGGAPQQITLGLAQENNLVVVWRPHTEDLFYYQLSDDNGATWSQPQPIPGVIAKPWDAFSLDAYDAASDSAGNVHLLVLGRLESLEEDLALIHLVWDGSAWSAPASIFASSDPPEWPRIGVGVGNQVYATWFTRDKKHIWESERGRYKVWISFYQANAPHQTPLPHPTQTPTAVLIAQGPTAPPPTPTLPLDIGPGVVKLLPDLYTESDDVARLILAISPAVLILLAIVALRFGWLRRRG